VMSVVTAGLGAATRPSRRATRAMYGTLMR
jgi:hypothetical protein